MQTLNTSQTRTTAPDLVGSVRRPFLTPISDAPGEFLFVIDNTAMDKVKRCHEAGANYLLRGRESHVKDAALVFGGAVHEGLELFHKRQWHGTIGDLAEEAKIDAECGAIAQDAAIRKYFLDNPTPPDSFRTENNALQVLAAYRRRCDILLHPDYEWEILSDASGAPLVERAFELPLGVIEVDFEWQGQRVNRIHIAWSGRIDVAVHANTRNRIADNKTTTILDDRFIQSFVLASQTTGYLWAGRQLWPHLDLTGFCLNVFYINKKAAESATLAGRSIIQPGPRGGEAPLKLERFYFDYTPARIDEWALHQLHHVEDFFHSVARGVFPLNDRNCVDKYGRCPYHDVCVMDEPLRLPFLNSDAFKSVTWNPTA